MTDTAKQLVGAQSMWNKFAEEKEDFEKKLHVLEEEQQSQLSTLQGTFTRQTVEIKALEEQLNAKKEANAKLGRRIQALQKRHSDNMKTQRRMMKDWEKQKRKGIQKELIKLEKMVGRM